MQLKTILTHLASASSLTLAAFGAHATTYDFTLTGGYNASWQLSSSPTPDSVVIDLAFTFYDVDGTFGASSSADILNFYNTVSGGGLSIRQQQLTLVDAYGQQLYTNSEAEPTFSLGLFSLKDASGGDAYTLMISSVNAVPEPATVTVMLAGLGLVGFASKRRRKAVVEAVGSRAASA